MSSSEPNIAPAKPASACQRQGIFSSDKVTVLIPACGKFGAGARR
jgi:hypothetical protein